MLLRASFRFQRLSLFALVTAILLLLPTLLSAQKPRHPENTLLWEVSGNGLSGKSYLYGTMHVRSRRVHDLADSVLIALRSCRVFMPEGDLDSMGTAMFRMMFSPDTSVDLRKLLTPERYRQLDTEMRASMGISIESTRHMKPWMIPYLVRHDTISLDADRPAILDAWLSRVARLEGLRVVGLESMEEHLATLEALPAAQAWLQGGDDDQNEPANGNSRATAEAMIRLYVAGDLDGLARLVDSLTPTATRKIILTDRNRRMAERLEPAMRADPVFVAVGAAHLPGDEGLIALLRSRGFTVRPVRQVKTGLARKYAPPSRKLPWHHLTDSARGFELDMPSEPADVPIEYADTSEFRMAMAADFGTGSFYTFVTGKVPSLASRDERRLIDGIIQAMYGHGNAVVLSTRKLPIADGAGTEIELGMKTKPGARAWARTIVRGERMYIACADVAYARTRPTDVDRFFSSLSFTGAAVPRASASWREISLPRGACVVTMPADTVTQSPRVSGEANQSTEITMITTHDGKMGLAIFDHKLDFVILEDSLYLAQLMTAPLNLTRSESRVVRPVSVQGYPGFDISGDAESGGRLRARILLRGNRGYMMFIEVPISGDTSAASRYIESIRFTDPPEAAWRPVTIDSLGISVLLPGVPFPPQWQSNRRSSESYGAASNGTIDELYARDTASSLLYGISCKRFAPYTWLKDSTVIDANWRAALVHWNDSLISRSTYTVGACPVIDLVYRRADGGKLVRVKTVLVGHAMIRATLVAPERDMRGAVVDRFFGSVVPIDSLKGTDLFIDGTSHILRDVQSDDPSVAAAVRAGLRGMWFSADDVPTMLAMLDRPLPDDTAKDGRRLLLLGGLRTVIRMKGFEKILDSATVRAIAEKVSSLLPELAAWPRLRTGALNTLMSLHVEHATAAVLDDLRKPGADTVIDGSLAGSLSEIARRMGDILPTLLRRIDTLADPVPLMMLANACADSLPASVLAPLSAKLTRVAIATAGDTDRFVDWKSSLETSARMLAHLPRTDTAVVVLRKLERNSRWGTRLAAQCALLSHGEGISMKALDTMAADTYWRWEVYERLAGIGREDLLPPAYRNVAALAESAIEQDSDGDIENPVLLAEREARLNGSDYRIVVFKLQDSYEDEEEDSEGGTKNAKWYPAAVCLKMASGRVGIGARPVVWYGDESFDPAAIEEYVGCARASIGGAAK